ncbi:MAG: hypothetical protein MI743_21855 [Sneathiellales bacterium]|nr:hypothetical protein [Sneathiellales bacterium]
MDVAKDTEKISNLLKPRDINCWEKKTGFLSPWARPILIDNKASRRFREKQECLEAEDKACYFNAVEEQLISMKSLEYRFWMAEYAFMSRLLDASQLQFYVPAFIQLAHLMPRKLIFHRRQGVRKFLKNRLVDPNPFVQVQTNKFVRSSVLLYPARLLFEMAELFVDLIRRSENQSFTTNRLRVLMSVRAHQLLSDEEICGRFKKRSEYEKELQFLQSQCQYYKIRVSEIYRISAETLEQYWAGL